MKLIPLVLYIFICLNLFSQEGSKKKIYSSFTVINDNLESTRNRLTKQINTQYFDLIKEKGNDSTLVSLVDSLRIKSNELVNYLSRIKIFLIIKTEEIDKNVVVENDTIIGLEHLSHFDDYFTPSELLIGENRWDNKKGKYTANEIAKKIREYIFFIKRSFNDLEKKQIYLDKYWDSANFYHKPLAGIITQLALIQLNIKLTEQATINSFYHKI